MRLDGNAQAQPFCQFLRSSFDSSLVLEIVPEEKRYFHEISLITYNLSFKSE
jgi:hypothetical protein